MPHPGPQVTKLSPGRHAICTCGSTTTAPFCDGSHKGSGLAPQILDVDAERPLAWCTCRTSGAMPSCDGSHKNVPHED